MSKTDAIHLVLAVLALAATVRLARTAPVPALVAVCIAGWALQAGAVALPAPAALGRAEADLAAWQDRQAARISCQVAARGALDRTEDEALALLERHCRGRASR